MARSKNVIGNIRMLIFYGILIRVLSIFKEELLLSVGNIEWYLIVFTIMNVYINLLGESIYMGSIPIFMDLDHRQGRKDKTDYANNLINISGALSLVLIIIGLIFSKQIYVDLLAGSPDHIIVFKLSLPLILLTNIRYIYAGYIQSHHGYKTGAVGNVFSPVVFIVAILIWGPSLNENHIMLISSLAVFAQIYSLYGGMKDAGYKYEFRMDFKDEYFIIHLKKFIKVLLLLVIMLISSRIDGILMTKYGFIIADGELKSVSILNILSPIFIMPIIIVFFPWFIEKNLNGDGDINVLYIKGIGLLALVGFLLGLVGNHYGASGAYYLYLLIAIMFNYNIRAYYSYGKDFYPFIMYFCLIGANITFAILFNRLMGQEGFLIGQIISEVLIFSVFSLAIYRDLKALPQA